MLKIIIFITGFGLGLSFKTIKNLFIKDKNKLKQNLKLYECSHNVKYIVCPEEEKRNQQK